MGPCMTTPASSSPASPVSFASGSPPRCTGRASRPGSRRGRRRASRCRSPRRAGRSTARSPSARRGDGRGARRGSTSPARCPREWRHPELVVDLGFTGAGPGFQAEGTVYAPDGVVLGGLEPRRRAVPLAGAAGALLLDAARCPCCDPGRPLRRGGRQPRHDRRLGLGAHPARRPRHRGRRPALPPGRGRARRPGPRGVGAAAGHLDVERAGRGAARRPPPPRRGAAGPGARGRRRGPGRRRRHRRGGPRRAGRRARRSPPTPAPTACTPWATRTSTRRGCGRCARPSARSPARSPTRCS